MLRELPDLSVDFTSAAWSIVRRGIAGTTSQAGSAEMCHEIGAAQQALAVDSGNFIHI
jgi:hypothetical protein